MREIKLLLKLAKRVRTPQEAVALFFLASLMIGIIYLIPADLFDE